ncbi:MAG TPA: tRNA lysidine(34) synthetase TilS [Rhodocyclaceae bacterium]
MASSANRPSTDDVIAAALSRCLEEHVTQGQTLCVAYSGGLDSTVLLDALAHLLQGGAAFQLRAVHVDHGLSPHAKTWATHCTAVCGGLGVPLHVEPVVVVNRGGGVEAAARDVRYRILDRQAADWILLAHHREDQAETLMLNLLRGAGVHGAAGMPEIRGRYLRPLLDVPRWELRKYALEHKLTWVEDESNASDALSRNFLRNQVIPQLQARFPAATQTLARMAQRCREASSLLDQLAILDGAGRDPLDLQGMQALGRDRAANALTTFLRRHDLPIPGQRWFDNLLEQLLSAADDTSIRVCLAGRELRVFRHALWIVVPDVPPDKEISWQGETPLSWGEGAITAHRAKGSGVRATAAANTLSFRRRRGGERMRLHAQGPRRPLKDLLRESGMPPWRRNSIPLLFAGEELIWVPGVGIAGEWRCLPDEDGIYIEFSGPNW